MLNRHLKDLGGFYESCPAIAMIVTARRDSEKDAMAAAWHSPISFNPPLYGVSISPKRHSHRMILHSKEFGVNFVPFSLAKLVAAVGGCSGRNVDKFEMFAIEEISPVEISVPLIRDSYAAYECTLSSSQTYGDHEWFVGEIVATHVDSAAFGREGVIDTSKAAPTLYLGADRYLRIDTYEDVKLDRKESAGQRD